MTDSSQVHYVQADLWALKTTVMILMFASHIPQLEVK